MNLEQQVGDSRSRWRRAVLMVVKVLVVLLGAWLVVVALRRVDWAQVGDALGRLQWWQIIVVTILVLVRQMVTASTLPILLPGLGFPRAVSTAFSGTLVQTVSPPPADTVLRLSILKSYGVPTTRATAALLLDTMVFYIARLVAPIVGLALAMWSLSVGSTEIWMAVVGAAGAGLLVGALAVVSNGEGGAYRMGRGAGGMVKRVRPSTDPESWADAMTRFQRESATGIRRRVGLATPVMLGYIAVDGLVLVMCLRFVGVPAEYIGYVALLAALFSLYPLTVFPFAGLGVLDASLIVLINADGLVDQADLVAALVIWRAATLLLPLLFGLVALIHWRVRHGQAGSQIERV